MDSGGGLASWLTRKHRQVGAQPVPGSDGPHFWWRMRISATILSCRRLEVDMWKMALALALFAALPAQAASLLIVSRDARVTHSLADALSREGGKVVAAKTVAPRMGQAELRNYLDDLLYDQDPDYLLYIGKSGTIIVSNAWGRYLGQARVEKRALTGRHAARRVARNLLQGLERFEAAEAQRRARPTERPDIAVPLDAPYVDL